jgi:hypothetical protein
MFCPACFSFIEVKLQKIACFMNEKCFYLNHMDIPNLAALNKAVQWVTHDYGCFRPHAQLNGLTPLQAYTGQRPEEVSFALQLEEVKKFRITLNQKHACSAKCNV